MVQMISHNPVLCRALANGLSGVDAGAREAPLSRQLADVCEMLNSNPGAKVNPGGLVGELYRQFPFACRPNEQMDICELWMLISDKIAEELGQPVEVAVTGADADAEGSDMIAKSVHRFNNAKSSLWLRQIQTIQVSLVRCAVEGCGHTLHNTEVQSCFPLELMPQHTQSNVHDLSDLLLHHFSLEKLRDWKCDACAALGGVKLVKLHTLPAVLFISIKRFAMNDKMQFRKINCPVNVHEDLTFKIGDRSWAYKLASVGHHMGDYNWGHYNATVSMTTGSDMAWKCYDDDNVSDPVTDPAVFQSSRSAYLLCYNRVD